MMELNRPVATMPYSATLPPDVRVTTSSTTLAAAKPASRRRGENLASSHAPAKRPTMAQPQLPMDTSAPT
ncbi:hypothetical protein WR25_25068 [Diploscapter pachys]|uniref:Uncharacterized protein n=1 Tax=Diploscapter pachys TaxID=2018661 RepID=A0A2A2M611_9BILA|nr:hypothetical protein WR25_25068 [Diploscapter pachys]